MILLLLFCLCFGQGQNRAAESQTPAKAQQNAAQNPSPVIESSETGKTGQRSEQNQSKAQWSDPLVVLNFALFVAVLIQAGIYWKQLIENRNLVRQNGEVVEAVKGQLGVMRDTLEQTQRDSRKEQDFMEIQMRGMEIQGRGIVSQIEIMAESLVQTGKIISQNEKTVETAQGQLDAMRKQSDLMGNALAQSEETRKIENRAFVGITNVGFDKALLADAPLNGETIRLAADVKNVGKTPAKNYHGYMHGAFAPDNESPPEATEIEHTSLPEKGSIIMPGCPVRMNMTDLKRDEETAFKAAQPNIRFYVWGRLDYDDVFDEPHHTKFAFVNESPYSTEFWACAEGNDMT